MAGQSPAMRPSAERTFRRRMEVHRLRMRGVSQSVICGELGISQRMVEKDCQWLREHLRDAAVNADRYLEIGEAMARLREIEQEALIHMTETTNPHAKNNFLITALTACEKRVRLMMDAGVIARAATEVSLTVEDVSKMSTDELLAVRAKLTSRIDGIGVSAGGGSRN